MRFLGSGNLFYYLSNHSNDTLAERLRRQPAKPMGSSRVGLNPTGLTKMTTLTSFASVALVKVAGSPQSMGAWLTDNGQPSANDIHSPTRHILSASLSK